MKKSKIAMLYDLYAQNPQITNEEAADVLDVSNAAIRKMKCRLKAAGNIQVDQDGTVTVLEPHRGSEAAMIMEPTSSRGSYKAEVYYEMIETYMDDFRQQATFNDRLSVGREIRRLLEKL